VDRHQADFRPLHPAGWATGGLLAALVAYAALLPAFWLAALHFKVEDRIGGHLPSAFLSFALLLLPYWLFGFGLADALRPALRSRALRLLAPAVLVCSYLVYSLPRQEFHPLLAAPLIAIPIFINAIFLLFSVAPESGLCWQDGVVLVSVGLPVEFGWLRGAWPHSGLGAMPKLLLLDALLFAFLVVRQVPGVGFDFRPRLRDLALGLREWVFFAPLAIVLGLGLGFIRFHAYAPSVASVAAGWLITFFLVAIPEELFFRGLLQNLLEKRLGSRRVALGIASVIFGLSHFNKPLPFNWRYVLLAALAGVFYGRAWRDRRRLLASGITHAMVDVVWSVWFK
jgi:membrane protease YdiL (CAAX protease family)